MRWLREVVRDNSKRENALACVLLALGAVTSFFLVLATLGWTGLLSSAAANWVQAFGSIGAIFGAAWLADRSRRHGLEDKRIESVRREVKAINLVLMAATHTHTNLFHISLALGGNPGGDIGQFIRGAKAQAAVLETALEGIEDSLGIWALAYQVSQETPAVCDEAEAVWKNVGLDPENPEYQAARVAAAARALRSTNRVMQNAADVSASCRSYLAQAANA